MLNNYVFWIIVERQRNLMALINYATREINAKIVYYGPGLSGKTTNIHYVFKRIKPGNKGKLVSLATQGDRTIFFDFLPVELGNIKGFKTRFHLYTVPGQVFYNSTRKMVLKGSDGVVFVADSQKMMMEENLQSLENLKTNLREMGLDFDKFPVVFQYNKRDLPNAAPLEELNEFINPSGLPYFEASAVRGEGVLKTLTSMVKYVLHDLKETPDTHSLDFAAIEKAADSISEGASPLFTEETPARPRAAKTQPKAQRKPAIKTPEKTTDKAPVAGVSAASAAPAKPPVAKEPLSVQGTGRKASVSGKAKDVAVGKGAPERVHTAAPRTSGNDGIPKYQTMEASAKTEDGRDDEFELPEASPEIFGAFGQPEQAGAADEEVFDAVEVPEGLGDTISAPERPSQGRDTIDRTGTADVERELSRKDLETFSGLASHDDLAEPRVKTLGEFMDTVPPADSATSSDEAIGMAGEYLDIPDEFHPDIDSGLTEGLDLSYTPDTDEGHETRPARPAVKVPTPDKPAGKGMRVKKSFRMPVRLATKTGVKEVFLKLNVDMEISGEGLDSLEGVELVQPTQENAAQTRAPRHEKDQSKHPPPRTPETKHGNTEITEPLIRIRKKGMLEKMFGR